MPDELAGVIIVGIISATVAISMVAAAIAKVVASRRGRELPESSIARIEQRLDRMEQAIDAMATEVERVADGQQFTTRLLAERQVERQA